MPNVLPIISPSIVPTYTIISVSTIKETIAPIGVLNA